MSLRQWLLQTGEAAIVAAARGAGLTRVLSYQVADDVRSGRLRIALASAEPPPVPVNLVYSASRRASANVQAFVQLARQQFARHQPEL